MLSCLELIPTIALMPSDSNATKLGGEMLFPRWISKLAQGFSYDIGNTR